MENCKVGYHIETIIKGELGTSSKILEEVHELIDAENQNNKIMTLLELSDIYGALQIYIETNFPMFTIDDIKCMSDTTRRVFINGFR